MIISRCKSQLSLLCRYRLLVLLEKVKPVFVPEQVAIIDIVKPKFVGL